MFENYAALQAGYKPCNRGNDFPVKVKDPAGTLKKLYGRSTLQTDGVEAWEEVVVMAEHGDEPQEQGLKG